MNIGIEDLHLRHLDRVAEIASFGPDPDGYRRRILAIQKARVKKFMCNLGETTGFHRTVGLIATDHDEDPEYPLGYLLAGVIDPIPAIKRAGHTFLIDVCVDPLYRRRGVGRVLAGTWVDFHRIQVGCHVWAAVPEPMLDVQCLLRDISNGGRKPLSVTPGGAFDGLSVDTTAAAILSGLRAEERYTFHFRPPQRVNLSGPARPGKKQSRRWESERDRRSA